MADDSSRRATINVLSLIYGLNIPPASIYSNFLFSSKLLSAGRVLPKIHLLIKNRITQYMGPASAYNSVLMSIDNDINTYLMSVPDIFTFNLLQDGVVEVRDFQTTGVVSFAEGTPFSRLSTGRHYIFGNETQIRSDYLQNCMESVDQIVHKL
jgi:hypothetical protein